MLKGMLLSVMLVLPLTVLAQAGDAKYNQVDQAAWTKACVPVFEKADVATATEYCSCAWRYISGGVLPAKALENKDQRDATLIKIGAKCQSEENAAIS